MKETVTHKHYLKTHKHFLLFEKFYNYVKLNQKKMSSAILNLCSVIEQGDEQQYCKYII